MNRAILIAALTLLCSCKKRPEGWTEKAEEIPPNTCGYPLGEGERMAACKCEGGVVLFDSDGWHCAFRLQALPAPWGIQ